MSKVLVPPPSCNVFTPDLLAAAMVRALGDASRIRWMEPCVGKGAFLRALANHGVNAKRIVGLDLSRVSEPTDSLAQVRRGTEFLRWATFTDERFDRVVANPPYIGLSKLPDAIQSAAMAVQEPGGSRVTKGANCWYAFLCASLRVLKTGGSLAFVLPAAFEYADYAQPLRDSLPRLFARVSVHRCRAPLFEAVDDGSVVLIGQGYQQPHKNHARFESKTLEDLVAVMDSPSAPNAESTSLMAESTPQPTGCVRLGEVMTVGLGAVTGDTSYFLMTEEERRLRELPATACIAVLSKAKHLGCAVATSSYWQQLKSDGERVWLFRPTPAIQNHPAVRRYLRLSLAKGGCDRSAYKIANRQPWYLPPLPDRPHGFLSGMSQSGPWICLNAMSRLTATNTLYSVRFRRQIPSNAWLTWSLMLLTSTVREQLPMSFREYALGLRKLEPRDLRQLWLPVPRVDRNPAQIQNYSQAVEALLDGNVTRTMAIADRYTLG
ncbi:MAG: class I SAM-dependent methyltransferase [Planctomycetia bacterium]|nr:class I SAM-dependent methyltransferase [Planctomycetia bacterium]